MKDNPQCLKCDKPFDGDINHRLCPKCHEVNKRIKDMSYNGCEEYECRKYKTYRKGRKVTE